MATGKFPKDRTTGAFRQKALDTLKGFKNAKTPEKGFGGYSDYCTTEKDRGPYGKQGLAAAGAGRDGNTVKTLKDTAKSPAKAREIIFEKLPTTKAPQGLYHPVRGEHPNL